MEHNIGEVRSDDGMYYLEYLRASYSFINCMAGRGHKSDSPNAAKYAAGGKLSRETRVYNASRE